MIGKIIYVVIFIGYIYLLIKSAKISDDENVDEDIEFLSVADAIDEMNRTKEQLTSIEEMITDVSICSPDEHGKYISCEWMSSNGNKFKYDLLIDGENTATDEMLKIAYSERARLRTLLRQQIRNLGDRCNENCNENYHVVAERGVVRD